LLINFVIPFYRLFWLIYQAGHFDNFVIIIDG